MRLKHQSWVDHPGHDQALPERMQVSLLLER